MSGPWVCDSSSPRLTPMRQSLKVRGTRETRVQAGFLSAQRPSAAKGSKPGPGLRHPGLGSADAVSHQACGQLALARFLKCCLTLIPSLSDASLTCVTSFNAFASALSVSCLWHSSSENVSHSVVSASFVTSWTVAHQAPLSMGLSRQEYWSGLPCPPPGDLPNPGIKPGSHTLQANSLPSEPPAESYLIPCAGHQGDSRGE